MPPASTPRIATTMIRANSGIAVATDGSRELNGSNETVTKCRLATANTTNNSPSGITISAVRNFRMASLEGEATPARSGAGAGGRRLAVQPLAHFLAGLEERNALLVDRHMRAGARIAPRARRAVLYRKRAETAQFDAVAARQCGDDFIENGVDDVLDIPLVEVRVVLGDALDEFGFDHLTRDR